MGSIPIILDMHAEDAAILWIQRDRAVDAPHFNRKFLSRLDERLEANLDGLRVGGKAGWDAARAAYDAFPEPGEVFTLAALAFGAASKSGMGQLFDILSTDDDGRATRAAVSALGWLDAGSLRGLVQPLLDHRDARIRALGLGACSVHRVDPGDQLRRHLKDDPIVRQAALKLTGLLGTSDHKTLSSNQDDAACTFRAAWACVKSGDRDKALSQLWEIASLEGPYQVQAFELAALASETSTIGSKLKAFGPMSNAFAIRAAGIVGQVDMVEWLIDQMRDPELAQLAGESFAMMTGVDLAFLDLDAAVDEVGPNDDPNDTRVGTDPDDDLAMPNADAVADWWRDNSTRFEQGTRYVVGQPKGPKAYEAAFKNGFQRQRRVAALAIGSAAPSKPLPNWKSRERPQHNQDHAAGFWDVHS